jgi:hypothetical protein
MFRNLLFGIGLFGVTIANAKSYHVTLSEPYTVGAKQVVAGEYKIIVNGSTAALEDEQGKVQASGSLETETRKFENTAVVSDDTQGTPQLRTIEVGGTRLKIDFK